MIKIHILPIFAILLLTFVLDSDLTFAQEHSGNGRQQQTNPNRQQKQKKKKTIRRKKAEKMYQDLLKKNGATDLSKECSEPVMSVEGYEPAGTEYVVCFDRGDYFESGRFKCYIETNETRTHMGILLYNLFHEDDTCGGDGIFSTTNIK